jgi:hypothetical protein
MARYPLALGVGVLEDGGSIQGDQSIKNVFLMENSVVGQKETLLMHASGGFPFF